MALTAKPQSTIAYNTPEHLLRTLKALEDSQKIEKWYAICHDRDILKETGEHKKTHFHVWVKPNRRIDTMSLAKAFIEIDPDNPGKLLKCRPFQDSVLEHWLRYTIHDPVYLKMHNDDNDGRFEYSLSDYIAYDSEVLAEDYEKSACVLEASKEQQRDILADLITKSSYRHNADSLYRLALQRGLLEGYWSYQNALTRLAYDHNKDLEVMDVVQNASNIVIQSEIDRQQMEKAYTDIISKIEEADITGTAIKKIGDKTYVIYRKED